MSAFKYGNFDRFPGTVKVVMGGGMAIFAVAPIFSFMWFLSSDVCEEWGDWRERYGGMFAVAFVCLCFLFLRMLDIVCSAWRCRVDEFLFNLWLCRKCWGREDGSNVYRRAFEERCKEAERRWKGDSRFEDLKYLLDVRRREDFDKEVVEAYLNMVCPRGNLARSREDLAGILKVHHALSDDAVLYLVDGDGFLSKHSNWQRWVLDLVDEQERWDDLDRSKEDFAKSLKARYVLPDDEVGKAEDVLSEQMSNECSTRKKIMDSNLPSPDVERDKGSWIMQYTNVKSMAWLAVVSSLVSVGSLFIFSGQGRGGEVSVSRFAGVFFYDLLLLGINFLCFIVPVAILRKVWGRALPKWLAGLFCVFALLIGVFVAMVVAGSSLSGSPFLGLGGIFALFLNIVFACSAYKILAREVGLASIWK